MIIRKFDEFFDDNGNIVIIYDRHFNDFYVRIDEWNDEGEEFEYGHFTVMTAQEIKRITNAKEITWECD